MKKLFSSALIAALLLALAACGTPAAIPNPPLVLGEKYLTDLDYEQALLQFDQAITIEPKNPHGYLGKADALLHLGRQPDAVEALAAAAKQCRPQRAALAEAKDAVEKSPVDGYIGIAGAYEKLGWKDVALALLKRVCEELPEEGRLREALEGLISAVDISQDKESKTQGLGARMERRDLENGYEIWEYDSNDQVIRILLYDTKDVKTGLITWRYNEQGEMIRGDEYDADDRKIRFWTFQYNEQGQQVREDQYDAGGEKTGFSTIQYNEQGQAIRQDYYEADGIKAFFTIHQYSEQGKNIRTDEYDAEGVLVQFMILQENGELNYYNPDGTPKNA